MNETTYQQTTDELAKEYILSLKSGKMINEDRPNFDNWEVQIWEIEKHFKDLQKDSSLTSMTDFILDYCSQNEDLARLIGFNDMVKAHLLELQKGNIPDWPEACKFGDPWDGIISEIERYSRKCKGNVGLIVGKIESMYAQYPELEKLLNSTVQGGDEDSCIASNTEDIPTIKYVLPSFDTRNRPLMLAMNEYIDFSKELSPESYEWFHIGGFFTTLSIIAMRRIEIDFRDPTYTNLYIALCAKSTIWKKSSSAKAIERIINGIGLAHMLHKGEETPHFFVDQAKGDIPKNYPDLTKEQQNNVLCAMATAGLEALFFDELGHYLMATRKNPDNALWKRIILEWHECPENWRKGTKGGGWEIVEKTYLPIYGSMTPDNLGEGGMETFMRDGGIQRFIVIAPPIGTRAQTKSFKLGYLPTPPHLINAFRNWHERLGIPRIDVAEETEKDDKGREKTTYVKIWIDPLKTQRISMTTEAYSYWNAYREAIAECIAENNIPSHIAAYYERLGTDYAKVAALAASYEGCNLIDTVHLAMVYPFIEEGRKGIHRGICQSGREISEGKSYREKQASLENEVIAEIKMYLKKKDNFTIAKLLDRRQKLKRIPLSELNMIIDNFCKAGLLQKEVVTNERTKTKATFYRLV